MPRRGSSWNSQPASPWAWKVLQKELRSSSTEAWGHEGRRRCWRSHFASLVLVATAPTAGTARVNQRHLHPFP